MKPMCLVLHTDGTCVISHNCQGIWTQLNNFGASQWGMFGMTHSLWGRSSTSSIPGSWGKVLANYFPVEHVFLISLYLFSSRIPEPWVSAMTQFVEDYEREAGFPKSAPFHQASYILLAISNMILGGPWRPWDACRTYGTAEWCRFQSLFQYLV